MRRAPLPTTLALFCLTLFSTLAGAADVRIDSSIRYQTIDGFGSFAYAPGDNPILSPQKFADLYVKDLGASIIRMSVGPDASPTPDLDLDHLNLDNRLHMDAPGVAPIGKARLAAIEPTLSGQGQSLRLALVAPGLDQGQRHHHPRRARPGRSAPAPGQIHRGILHRVRKKIRRSTIEAVQPSRTSSASTNSYDLTASIPPTLSTTPSRPSPSSSRNGAAPLNSWAPRTSAPMAISAFARK